LVRGVAQALPFAPATFDTVLATFPSEYILHPDTLAEVQRVLRNDGQWLLVDAPRFTRTSWSIYLIDLAYRRILGTSLVVAQNTTPSPSPYHAIFQRAGMDDSTIHEVPVGDSSVLVMVGKRATQ
jgi:ubiquinone/menaquinone biosynthesis C-methylase UbiE